MIERLFQIVYLLMERDCISAKELAQKLEVSVRTINRDIEKLSEAKIPIYTTRGRNGGISLLPDFVLNKKVLTEEEKSSILSSMKLMGTVAYDDEKEALQRLENFFGEVAQDWIEIELDAWGEGYFDKERFKTLKTAIITKRKVTFDYMKKKQLSHRRVRPCKLVFRSQAWYLYAFCEERQDFRYFKFHRMNHLEITEERFDPIKMPHEEQPYIDKMTKIELVVAIDKGVAYRAFDELDVSDVKEEQDRYVFTLKNVDSTWIAGYFLSYGQYAKVLSPRYIADEILQTAKQIAELYAKD